MGQVVEEKENSEFKLVKLRLKIDLVSYLDRAERLVNRNNNRSIIKDQTSVDQLVNCTDLSTLTQLFANKTINVR